MKNSRLPDSKCFVYTRSSQDRGDRQALSIQGQKQALKPIFAKEGLAPIWMPSEEQSAHKPGRPIFNNMMDRIEAGSNLIQRIIKLKKTTFR